MLTKPYSFMCGTIKNVLGIIYGWSIDYIVRKQMRACRPEYVLVDFRRILTPLVSYVWEYVRFQCRNCADSHSSGDGWMQCDSKSLKDESAWKWSLLLFRLFFSYFPVISAIHGWCKSLGKNIEHCHLSTVRDRRLIFVSSDRAESRDYICISLKQNLISSSTEVFEARKALRMACHHSNF